MPSFTALWLLAVATFSTANSPRSLLRNWALLSLQKPTILKAEVIRLQTHFDYSKRTKHSVVLQLLLFSPSGLPRYRLKQQCIWHLPSIKYFSATSENKQALAAFLRAADRSPALCKGSDLGTVNSFLMYALSREKGVPGFIA